MTRTITDEQIESLGKIVDKLASDHLYTSMLSVRLENLRKGLLDLCGEVQALYRELGGEE